MNTQIFNRLGVAHVRDTMEQFVNGTLTRGQAMDSLRIGQSRLYELQSSYLAARAPHLRGCQAAPAATTRANGRPKRRFSFAGP